MVRPTVSGYLISAYPDCNCRNGFLMFSAGALTRFASSLGPLITTTTIMPKPLPKPRQTDQEVLDERGVTGATLLRNNNSLEGVRITRTIVSKTIKAQLLSRRRFTDYATKLAQEDSNFLSHNGWADVESILKPNAKIVPTRTLLVYLAHIRSSTIQQITSWVSSLIWWTYRKEK